MKMEQAKNLLLTTDLTNAQIRRKLRCKGQVISDALASLGSEYAKARKARMYARSKQGDRNPMLGKFKEEHHNYKGVVGDSKGYLMELKPDWYVGRRGSKHVFQHHLVYCKANDLTCIPAGYCVHHCNEDKTDNSLDNLVLMTLAEHTTFHQMNEGATTISQESTAKWLEAHRAARKQS